MLEPEFCLDMTGRWLNPADVILRVTILQTQAVRRDFFLKTVPLLDEGDDVAMVLTPQAFHNLDLDSDIFNHSNIHFWE